MLFGKNFAPTAAFNNCTCCVIKPHIVQEGLDRPTAEEFFEVYKGVLPEFVGMVEHMTTGPCIVLEVRQENAVKSFRELCGPTDPEIAKYLRPNTIRAKFGHSRTINAVHCTDLEEDGLLEVEYFFSIQQQ